MEVDTKNEFYRIGLLTENYSAKTAARRTRKPCYRKGDRAMRPIYGCPEKFRESLHGYDQGYFVRNCYNELLL